MIGDVKRIVLDGTADDGIIFVHAINENTISSKQKPYVCINDLYMNYYKDDKVSTIFGFDIIVDAEDVDKYAIPSDKYRGRYYLTDAGKELINNLVENILKIISPTSKSHCTSDRECVIVTEYKIVGDTVDCIEYVGANVFDAYKYTKDTLVRDNTLEILDKDLFINSVEQLKRILPYKLYSDGIIRFYTTDKMVRNYCNSLEEEINNGKRD